MNPHTKFEVSSCTHSRNMEGVPKLKKSRSRDVDHAPFDLVLHFLVCRPRDQSAHQIWSFWLYPFQRYRGGPKMKKWVTWPRPRPFCPWNTQKRSSLTLAGSLCHCACAVSRDLKVEGQKRPHIRNPRPQFVYSVYNFYGATVAFTLPSPLLIRLLLDVLLILSLYR